MVTPDVEEKKMAKPGGLLPVSSDDTHNLALKVLLVDDDPISLMLARLQIQKVWPAAEVSTIEDAREAMDLVAAQEFDVLFIDLNMPHMNGIDLTRMIRDQVNKAASDLPLLGLTASTFAQDWQRCLEAGMNEVLPKPLESEVLLETLRRYAKPPAANGCV